jgi:general stress protein YciG
MKMGPVHHFQSQEGFIMSNQQHPNDSTDKNQSGSKSVANDHQKPGEAGRKGGQQSHAAGSGSTTGDPGKPRGEADKGKNAGRKGDSHSHGER